MQVKLVQLINILLLVTLCFSSMETCLKDLTCKNDLDQTYGKKIKKVITAWHPGILKEINTVPNLIISSDVNDFLFSGVAVDFLKQEITHECKSTIKPINKFSFFYEFSGTYEEKDRYNNMNCFLSDYQQFQLLQKCISPQYFDIYDKKREQLVTQVVKKCKKFLGFKYKCKNEYFSRIDIFIDKIICFKQTNNIYDAQVDIAKKDWMFHNGGKLVINLLQELPANGTDFLKTCMPNCQECSSYKKCNLCNPQYSLIKNKCIECDVTCLSCSSGKNSKGCLTCKDNFVLYENQCLKQCPPGFLDQKGVCLRCEHHGCKICSGMATQCVQCFDNFQLQGQKCFEKCQDGQFLNTDSLKCEEILSEPKYKEVNFLIILAIILIVISILFVISLLIIVCIRFPQIRQYITIYIKRCKSKPLPIQSEQQNISNNSEQLELTQQSQSEIQKERQSNFVRQDDPSILNSQNSNLQCNNFVIGHLNEYPQ